MFSLYFERLHTKGTLKGLVTTDTITFTDRQRAIDWVKGVHLNSKIEGRMKWKFRVIPFIHNLPDHLRV